MGKVKDLLWEPKDFDQVWDEMINDQNSARDYHEAIASLKVIVDTHLSCDELEDKLLMWHIKKMINRLKRRL